MKGPAWAWNGGGVGRERVLTRAWKVGATALLGEWSQDICRRHSWHGGGHLSMSEVEPWHFSSIRRQVSLSSLPTPEQVEPQVTLSRSLLFIVFIIFVI